MIKTASKIYKNQYIPSAPKLRRSSGNINLENFYVCKQNIEEYNLYRKQEIIFITDFINFYKNKNIILSILNQKCTIYNQETGADVLDIYLLPNIKHYHIDNNKIIKYSFALNSDSELKTFICEKMENVVFNCMAVEITNYLGSNGLWFKYKKNILVNLNYLWYFIDDIYRMVSEQ